MAFNLDQKQAVVAEVADVATRSHAVIAAQYAGLTVAQMTALRTAVKQVGVHMQVVRNTLARRALAGTEFECLTERLSGPLVLAFAQQDPGAAARAIADFAKLNPKLVVHAIAFGGRLLEGQAIDALAKMPTRDEALSLLLALLKAPVGQLVRTIAEPHARLVRTVGAVRDQKQAA